MLKALLKIPKLMIKFIIKYSKMILKVILRLPKIIMRNPIKAAVAAFMIYVYCSDNVIDMVRDKV